MLISRLDPGLPLPTRAIETIGFVVGLGIVVFGHMVIGEVVPKNLSLAGPEPSAEIRARAKAQWEWLSSEARNPARVVAMLTPGF